MDTILDSNINVAIKGYGTVSVPVKTKIYDLYKLYGSSKNPIILAKVDNDLIEMNKPVIRDCELEFLDTTDANGFKVYQRSLSFLMIYAIKEILGKDTRVIIEHSTNKNYYCEIANYHITEEFLSKVEAKIQEVVDKDIVIEKKSVPLDEGIEIAKRFGLNDKVSILNYRTTSNVNFYILDWFYDYFYGHMAYSTGCLRMFKLNKKSDGFILQFPKQNNFNELGTIGTGEKIFNIFREANEWARILKVDTVGSLNDVICGGGVGELVRIAEALHEKKIANIADMICSQNKRVVLIAGPSSSGKTTFAQRLRVQLRVNGKRAHIISLDNYFKGAKSLVYDEFGEIDFESVDFLDSECLNNDIINMLNGENVQLPVYNFFTMQREYKGHYLQLADDEILICEGIHALNNKVTERIPADNKFKIFISALTQLNVDDHNRIPTTDTRLIRRIVRDYQYRGANPSKTIAMWDSVMRGEIKNIFPYQEEADAIFNSALIYEMCILKQFVEPLLFRVDKISKEHIEAKRLLKFLDCFLGLDSEGVPRNSILREFIGGGCFNT